MAALTWQGHTDAVVYLICYMYPAHPVADESSTANVSGDTGLVLTLRSAHRTSSLGSRFQFCLLTFPVGWCGRLHNHNKLLMLHAELHCIQKYKKFGFPCNCQGVRWRTMLSTLNCLADIICLIDSQQQGKSFKKRSKFPKIKYSGHEVQAQWHQAPHLVLSPFALCLCTATTKVVQDTPSRQLYCSRVVQVKFLQNRYHYL